MRLEHPGLPCSCASFEQRRMPIAGDPIIQSRVLNLGDAFSVLAILYARLS